MKLEERASPAVRDETAVRRWQPHFTARRAAGPKERSVVLSGDESYVVIDDIRDSRVVLRVSAWPTIDPGGRLKFDTDPWNAVADLSELQAAVNRARTANKQEAPDRPLRVGDVFAMRGLQGAGGGVGRALRIIDVSAAARETAKAALYGAAASTVDEEYADDMSLESVRGDPAVGRGVFDIRQQARTTPPPGTLT